MRRTILAIASLALIAAPSYAGLGDLIARHGGRATARSYNAGPFRTAAFRRTATGSPSASASAAPGSASSSTSAPAAAPAAVGLSLGDALRSTRGQCSNGSCDR